MSDETVLQVGAGKQFATINAAIAAADQMGGNADIKVDAGTYTNDGGYLWDGINNVTIEGVGGTVKIVDPTYYAGGKAAIVTGGQNIVLKNLDISGVAVPDGNGAGVRYDQGTLLLDNVSLHGNQNGILGAADATGSITIQNSEIYGNGTSAGNTHNIYIGDVAQFTLTNSYVHDANVGHEVKSRAENNTITNNRIEDNSGTSSYSIDLPNGGNATITGNVIEQGANGQNHIINSYGEEGNLHTGNAVTFSNNTVVNDNPAGAGPVWSNNGAVITGTGNTVWNTTDLGNGVSSSSFTALSTRPTLNTSSTSSGSTTPTPTPTSTALQPLIRTITGNRDGGATLAGASTANSTVTVMETTGNQTVVLGTTVASSSGLWQFTNHTLINRSTVHSFSVGAQDQSGKTAQMMGSLFLDSSGIDNISGNVGATDVFAVMSTKGSETINKFETLSASGSTHDYIDFSGRGITSFSQVQPLISGSTSAVISLGSGKTITLADVAPNSLTAGDFRFS